MTVVLDGEKTETLKNCNLLPDFLNLILIGAVCQNDQLNKILDYFSSAVIPFMGLCILNKRQVLS